MIWLTKKSQNSVFLLQFCTPLKVSLAVKVITDFQIRLFVMSAVYYKPILDCYFGKKTPTKQTKNQTKPRRKTQNQNKASPQKSQTSYRRVLVKHPLFPVVQHCKGAEQKSLFKVKSCIFCMLLTISSDDKHPLVTQMRCTKPQH